MGEEQGGDGELLARAPLHRKPSRSKAKTAP